MKKRRLVLVRLLLPLKWMLMQTRQLTQRQMRQVKLVREKEQGPPRSRAREMLTMSNSPRSRL